MRDRGASRDIQSLVVRDPQREGVVLSDLLRCLATGIGIELAVGVGHGEELVLCRFRVDLVLVHERLC
jgi:hypothetical protein